VPLSTSSFERTLPVVSWSRILGAAVVIFLIVVFSMEARLAQLGYRPTFHDSHARWASQRARASQLGNQALILIGASRIQVGIDTDILRRETGLEPVQLAIDGSASGSILAGLAADPSIVGTVIVDYYDASIGAEGGPAELFQKYYERGEKEGSSFQPSERIEKILTEKLRESLLSYADDANPLNSLRARILTRVEAKTILVTFPDRSRLADYSVAKMPDHYYQRVARYLGDDVDMLVPNIETILAQKVAALKPMDNHQFLRNVEDVKRMVATIEARGGHVIFLAMPTSGMIREIENRRYPRAQFFDQFAVEFRGKVVQSADHYLLKGFVCPDGSHLDRSDRARFTAAMSRAVGLSRFTLPAT
jgi:hypothetical protein